VFEKRILWGGHQKLDESEQIHVHWFAPKHNAWYAEHTVVLKKVEANNEKY